MLQDFLVEIGTEELPPKALRLLSENFTRSVLTSLDAAKLDYQSHTPLLATPRRLALKIEGLQAITPARDIVSWGPPKQLAFNTDGRPSKAAEAFANKVGVDIKNLQIENDGKTDKLVHRQTLAGISAKELLPGIIQKAVDNLPVPKKMRWGSRRVEFVRPVHWVVMMLGNSVIECQILGIAASNKTWGHRFHCNKEISLDHPRDYQHVLEESFVLVSFSKRRELIERQVKEQAQKIGGCAVTDAKLLDEVTALVEWPIALTGTFESQFLQIPAEALISSMAEHQKYFHLVDGHGQLLPNFIAVSNIESIDPSQVIRGNERVIRPRLSDAAFFFETDKKIPLANRVEKLKTVVFQDKLGTLYDKTIRVQILAQTIAKQISGDIELAGRAAYLCKADLVSDMVLEFDKMQGIAGSYYAINDGEPKEVANAIQDHYLPRFAGDSLPRNLTGCAVALADRLDTIIGIFGIGQAPTGSKDPYALRRASLGVLRIIIEQKLDLDLLRCLSQAYSGYADLHSSSNLVETVFKYMIERLRAWYEEENIPAEVFMSVMAKNLSHPVDIDRRVHAVYSFCQLAESQSLASANKRVSNILTKDGENCQGYIINSDLLREDAEAILAEAVARKQAVIAPLVAKRDYNAALGELAELKKPVDLFFDQVMVMVDDQEIRNNRLALLQKLRNLFLEIADISCLAVSGK